MMLFHFHHANNVSTVFIVSLFTVLLGTSYSLAEQFDSEYWPFFWWLCIWTAILHFLTAITGLVNFVWHISPFTTQIFEFFIGCSFVFESIRDLVEPLHLGKNSEEDRLV